jgi:lipoprotein-releasing system permease protein
MPFSLFLALKYLKPKRTSTSVVTLISVIGVTLGVAIVIIVRAVMTGFGDEWEEKILQFRPHITITPVSHNVIREEEAICRRLEQIPGVVVASPGIETRVMVEYHRQVLAPLVIGTDPSRVQRFMNFDRIVSGNLDLEGDSVVIGIDMAQTLGVRTGDDIFVYSPMNLVSKDEVYLPERLKVTGVFDSGQRDFDSGYIFTSLAVARDLMGMKEGVYSISLKVKNPQSTKTFPKIVEDVKMLAPYFNVATWQEVDREIFNALAVEKNMMVILMMFITVVAIFCVTNTLIVLTVQKTDEIGLLKALGFSSRQVMFVFVLYGWIQCIVGTALGIGAAFLILHNLQRMVEGLARMGVDVFSKEIYGLAQIPWRVVPGEVAEIAVMVIAFCTVASFLPAWRASRLDPVAALRKE